MYPIANIKSALKEYFERQAEWRERKAEEHPEDTRNHRTVVCLKDLVDYISTLPDDDARLVKLANTSDGFVDPDGDVVHSLARMDGVNPSSEYYAVRCGFGTRDSSDEVFSYWCELFAEDVEAYNEWFAENMA